MDKKLTVDLLKNRNYRYIEFVSVTDNHTDRFHVFYGIVFYVCRCCTVIVYVGSMQRYVNSVLNRLFEFMIIF